jgi:hypothetical protein
MAVAQQQDTYTSLDRRLHQNKMVHLEVVLSPIIKKTI